VAPPPAGEAQNSLKPRTGPFTDRPSARLDMRKTANPFATSKSKHRTNFSLAYANGAIPCRINHGTFKHALQWDRPPQELDYAPLLITCAEGIGESHFAAPPSPPTLRMTQCPVAPACPGAAETEHPYVFVAPAAFKGLLEAPGAREKATPLAGIVANALRAPLMSKDDDVVLAALEAVRQLSATVGEALTQHLHALLVQINKKAFVGKFREPITATLSALEANGGPEALATIRSKVPTYSV
jgi:hypothetical protein